MNSIADRQQRDGNDRDGCQLDVVLDDLDLAEEVPEHRDAAGPQDGADHVGARRTCGVHLADAGHASGTKVRTMGTNRAITIALRAVLFEERVRPGDVGLAEQA